MTLFDPAHPPPPLPPAQIAAQLAAREALPSRHIPTRYLWIVGRNPATPASLDHAHAAAYGAFRLVSCNWHIILNDHDQHAPRIIESCRIFRIAYTVYGHNKNPVTRCPSSHFRRVKDVEGALLKAADLIVALDRPELVRKALKAGVSVWLNGRLYPAVQLRLWGAA